MRIIDLTHSFTDSMPVFPGDPPATLTQVASLDKEGYNDHQIKSYMHVGTHMDSPLHMIATGKKMDEISLDKCMGPGILIDARGKQIIDASILNDIIIQPGSIIFIYTGFGNKFRDSDYGNNQPTISSDFAQKVVDLKVKIVGMDILGPDQPPFLTHKILLSNEVLIIENLANLELLLKESKFDVIALPMKLHSDAAPVRVIAIIK